MAEGVAYPPDLAPQVVPVDSPAQVMVAQRAARALAGAIGFAETEREEIVIAASELATNLANHAHGGVLRFTVAGNGDRTGIRIESEDHGPGMADPGRALADGYSTAGGLGLGLGAVNRLMDELDFGSQPEGGARVTCHRWLRPEEPPIFPRELRFGVVTRSRRDAPENGDAFVVKTWPGHAVVGVIDGLGHGELAQRASQAARLLVESHYDLPLEDVFAGVERACRGTRGVVMALARFDLQRGVFRMGNVGNVEVRLLGGSEGKKLVVRRGILGLNAPRPVVTEHRWERDSVLVVHSDGVRSRWTRDGLPLSAWDSPAEAAQLLLQTQAREDDDATVVVVRGADYGS
jgi:anti-sigma regulatory factor (Ser/Thr protein kinase)/serine/threonine protein phosphatase PrpC